MGAQHRQFSADRRQGSVKKSASDLTRRSPADRRDGRCPLFPRRDPDRAEPRWRTRDSVPRRRTFVAVDGGM